MHPKFEKQSIFLYPRRMEVIIFMQVHVLSMKFDNGFFDLDQASECKDKNRGISEQWNPDFYRVSVLSPDIGFSTIADCGTKELAEQLQDVLLFAGKLFIREQ